jgi:hypothetical protein
MVVQYSPLLIKFDSVFAVRYMLCCFACAFECMFFETLRYDFLRNHCIISLLQILYLFKYRYCRYVPMRATGMKAPVMKATVMRAPAMKALVMKAPAMRAPVMKALICLSTFTHTYSLSLSLSLSLCRCDPLLFPQDRYNSPLFSAARCSSRCVHISTESYHLHLAWRNDSKKCGVRACKLDVLK